MKPTRKSRSTVAAATIVLLSALAIIGPGSGGDREWIAPESGGREQDLVAATRLATHVIESEGRTRTYAAWAPDALAGRGPRTLILEIHGSGSSPDQQRLISGLASSVTDSGAIVVFPVAIVPGPAGVTWNVPPKSGRPDDVSYLLDVVDDAARRYAANESRVFVVGFSGGARLASELAARRGERVAAFAAIGGLRSPEQEGPAVPVIAFHGTSDPINPWAGGGPGYWGYGVERAMQGWSTRNGCTGEVADAVAPGVVRRACLAEDEAAPVVLYRFEGGHVWPGSTFSFPAERFGAMPEGVDATRLVLKFFRRWGLPISPSRAEWASAASS